MQSKHKFKAEPGVCVTVEVGPKISRIEALQVANQVVQAYLQHLSTPIDTYGEEVPREQKDQDQGAREAEAREGPTKEGEPGALPEVAGSGHQCQVEESDEG